MNKIHQTILVLILCLNTALPAASAQNAPQKIITMKRQEVELSLKSALGSGTANGSSTRGITSILGLEAGYSYYFLENFGVHVGLGFRNLSLSLTDSEKSALDQAEKASAGNSSVSAAVQQIKAVQAGFPTIEIPITVRARYAFSPTWSGYGGLGLELNQLFPPPGLGISASSVFGLGLVAEAGVNYLFGPNWAGGLGAECVLPSYSQGSTNLSFLLLGLKLGAKYYF